MDCIDYAIMTIKDMNNTIWELTFKVTSVMGKNPYTLDLQ